MADVVLDASALLAFLWREAGSDHVDAFIAGAHVSAVNLAEVVTKLIDRGYDDATIHRTLGELSCDIEPFDVAAGVRSGFLRRDTRVRGLSLGERACLELSERLGLPVLTADRAWGELDLGVEVVLIR